MITLKDSTTPSTSAPVAVVVNNCVYTPSHYQFLAQFKEESSYSPVSFLPNPCAMLPSNQDATVTSTTASREDFGEYQPSLHIPYSFMAPMSSSGENATIDIESEIVTTNQPSTSMNNNHHLYIDNNQPNFEETNIFHDFTSTTTTTTLRNRQQNHVDMQSPQSFHHSDINRVATNTFQKVPPQPPDQQQQQQPPPQTMDLSNLSILYPLSGVDGLLPVDHDHVDHLISFLKGDGFNPNNTMDGRMTNNNNMELLVQANMSSTNDHSKMSFKNMLVGGHEATTCNIDTTSSYMHDTCINNEQQQQQPTPLVQDNNNAFTPHFAFRKRKNTKRKSISSSPSSSTSNSLDEDPQHVQHADLILDDEDISNDQFASDLQDQDDHSHSPTSIRNKSSTGSTHNTIGAKAYPNGRKRASKACLECQKRHTRCGFERPCDRCTKLGLNCVEVVSTKKRGRSTANMNNKNKLSEETLDLAPSRKKEKTSSRAPNQTASPSSNESNIENVNNASGSSIIEKQSESSNPNEASSSSIPNGSEQLLLKPIQNLQALHH
ncbi:hypothetical protein C9374_014312 [Naegleria lovaniensis]|uniref:Zn(2)-C6 fungal-type domain-containing protein n=1 Tax=Naegleria lovaniensis TaxID=51637 RepID=A0AA88G4M1_NAELO|nr:uncharacterized protein C9374_014312 [Naegleria lovaniensis]KAG2370701.1 hypothetical protein C9374_014312 [Naegleria lovaniensis]